jgi:hypothetical protein
MRTITKTFSITLLAIAFVGCASSIITNLTPSTLPRDATGLYHIEMEMDTSQQTLRVDSITPMVVVGAENYAMKPTLKMNNRWEAFVPIPASVKNITYYFKVNYLYNRFGKPGQGSKLSPEFALAITDK